MIAAIFLAAAIVAPPPAKYDYVPKRPVQIIEIDGRFIDAKCRTEQQERQGQLVVGCYFHGADTIWLRRGLSSKERREVLRHEYGHANGWRH